MGVLPIVAHMLTDEGMTQPPPPGCVQAPSIGSAGHVGVEHDDPIFVCVLTGDWPGSTDEIRKTIPDLGARYVQRLYEMVCRHAPPNRRFKFVCFTDRFEIPGIDIVYIREDQRAWAYFQKLMLFTAFPEGQRVIYLDLDTCIVGPWARLAEIPLLDIVMLRDIWNQPMPASGIMSWRAQPAYNRIWIDFNFPPGARPPFRHKPTFVNGGKGPQPNVDCRTDEHWLHHYVCPNGWVALQDVLPPGFLVSFKHSLMRWPVANRPSPPPLTPEEKAAVRIVYFHGRPRPHEVGAIWNKHYVGDAPATRSFGL